MSALSQLAGRRILFLNWRDLSNPAGGGAETYTEQIARRFAGTGARLTLFTSAYHDAPPYDWADQYLVVREGGRFGVYVAAARHLRRYGHQYDAIVDFQNGIPFFAPLWVPASVAVVRVIHHVHQAQFGMYFHWPLATIGRVLEGRVSRRVYRGYPLIAVSPSTRAEIRKQLGLSGPVNIVPNGIDLPPPSGASRSPTPAIAVVTRLMPHKQLHHLIEAVPDLLARWPDLQVNIAGTGLAREGLLAQVCSLGLERVVNMPGRVSEQVKSRLLSQAWLTVAPSLAEGWGLAVMEAAALGTPAVAYDVPGLRDSVRDQVTGWLVPPGGGLTKALMKALEELADADRRRVMAEQSRAWAGRFSWDTTAERLASILLSEAARRNQGSPSRRRALPLSTFAWWPPDEAEAVADSLPKALRITDMISRSEDGVTVLLADCDEVGASLALQRVPISPARLRLATITQALCGPGGDGQV
jgi:glycosyltransferase involved in cell wall biosynthesis